MSDRMKLRAGTSAEWAAADVALLANELGYDTDKNGFKIGDGVSLWAALPWITLTIGRTITATGSLAATDVNTFMISSVAAAHDITVEPDSTLGTDFREEMQIYVAGAGMPTLVAGAGVTLNGIQGFTALCTNSIVRLRRVAANTWDVELGGWEQRLGQAYTGTTHTIIAADVNTDNNNTFSNAGTITLTVPAQATLALSVGDVVPIKVTGAGKVTVAGAVGVQIDSYGDLLSVAAGGFGCLMYEGTVDTTEYWSLVGDLVA